MLEWALANAPEAVVMSTDIKAIREAVLAGTDIPGTTTEAPNHEQWQVKVK